MVTVVVSPEAATDIDNACLWYEGVELGLSDRLNLEFLHAFDRITQSPEGYDLAARNVRRILTRRFDYFIFYSIHENTINIIAVVHAHRHPKVWKRLLKKRS